MPVVGWDCEKWEDLQRHNYKNYYCNNNFALVPVSVNHFYLVECRFVRVRTEAKIKEARRCEPGSVSFDLSVLFSLDPLSSVLRFSFE